jgi:hypothetical protein
VIIYRTKFILKDNRIFYYVGKDAKNNKKYLGSGKLIPWFKQNSIYIQKIIIDTARTKNELTLKENYWLNQLDCCNSQNYLNITGYSSGGQIIKNYDKWKLSLKLAVPKRVESYKRACAKRTKEEKLILSKKLSEANKRYQKNMPVDIRKARKIKELETKSKRTTPQRNHESRLKSTASKKTWEARKANNNDMKEYSEKVSCGVKRYKASETAELKLKRQYLYQQSMYRRTGLLDYRDTVLDLLNQNKDSYDIYRYMKENTSLHVYHVGIKKFIEFVKLQYTI